MSELILCICECFSKFVPVEFESSHNVPILQFICNACQCYLLSVDDRERSRKRLAEGRRKLVMMIIIMS